jgi:hypothetical protein
VEGGERALDPAKARRCGPVRFAAELLGSNGFGGVFSSPPSGVRLSRIWMTVPSWACPVPIRCGADKKSRAAVNAAPSTAPRFRSIPDRIDASAPELPYPERYNPPPTILDRAAGATGVASTGSEPASDGFTFLRHEDDGSLPSSRPPSALSNGRSARRTIGGVRRWARPGW